MVSEKNEKKNISTTKRIALFLIGSIGLATLSTITLIVFSHLLNVNSNNESTVLTYINAISYILVMSIFIIILQPIKLIKIKSDIWKSILIGTSFGGLCLILSYIYQSFAYTYYEFGANSNESGIENMVHAYPIISIIIFVILGPCSEEITYRVGLFGAINKANKILAYIATVLIFALIHFDFTSKNIVDELLNLPSYIIGAIILTYTYDRYGIVASLSAHITNNFIAVLNNLI